MPKPRTGDSPQKGLLALGFTCLAGMAVGLIRLVPHPVNFSPIGALGLFSGARLRSWVPWVLPIAVMVVTDLALWGITGNLMYSPLHHSRAYVYGSFLIYVLLGMAISHKRSLGWILGAAVLGGLQFYLITNFFTWLCQPLYSAEELPAVYRYTRDLDGLLTCFLAGLPFYQHETFTLFSFLYVGNSSYAFFGTLLGDLFFTAVLFGLYGWLTGIEAGKKEVEPVLRYSLNKDTSS